MPGWNAMAGTRPEKAAKKGRGFSVQIYLADGAADGLWQISLGNWNGRALAFGRSQFKDLRAHPELSGAGVYFLYGEDANGQPRIYIGEAESLVARLSIHVRDPKRDFWNRVVVFTSSGGALNKAHVRYLESRLVQIAQDAGRAEVENDQSPAVPRLSDAERDDMETFLDNVRLILPIVGIPALVIGHQERGVTVYRFTGRGADSRGQYQSNGFLVLSGSTGPLDVSPSFVGTSEPSLRNRLIKQEILVIEGQVLRLTRDYLFNSPSAAAGVMGGMRYNGWTNWKDENGSTLDSNERAAIAPTVDREARSESQTRAPR